MNKSAKTLSLLLGVAVLSVGATYLAFKFTPLPQYTIANLEQVEELPVDPGTEESLEYYEDQAGLLEAKREQAEQHLAQARATLNERRERLTTLQDSLDAADKADRLRETTRTRVSKMYRRQVGDARQAELTAKINKLREATPVLQQLSEQLVKVGEKATVVAGIESEIQELESKLSLRESTFKTALENASSNVREFFLYVLGFKWLWGIFTGYARSNYPYTERNELYDTQHEYSSRMPGLHNRLTDATKEFQKEYASLQVQVARAQSFTGYDATAQGQLVANVLAPVMEAFSNYDYALLQLMREQSVFNENVTSIQKGRDYLPYGHQNASTTQWYNYQRWAALQRSYDLDTLGSAKSDLDAALRALHTTIRSAQEYIYHFIRDTLTKDSEIVTNTQYVVIE